MKKIAFFISIILLLNSCENVQRGGCMDPLAINFETSADFDDGSCLYVQGCTDPAAQNYEHTHRAVRRARRAERSGVAERTT